MRQVLQCYKEAYICEYSPRHHILGPSSGAVVAAAVRHAKEHGGRNVVILNDSAKNYTSTLLNNEWLLENDLADDLIMKELEYLSTDRYRAVRCFWPVINYTKLTNVSSPGER